MKNIKKIIKSIFKKNKYAWKFFLKVRENKRHVQYKKFAKKIKTDEKIILFEAFLGRKCVDSPKSIYLEMLKHEEFKDYTFIWAFKNIEVNYDFFDMKRTKIVKYASEDYIKSICKAKYIFSNSRLPLYLDIKDDQVFVQCWHGTPLKRLGFDIEVKGENAKMSNDELKEKYLIDAKKFKYLISPSKECSLKLGSAFNLKSLNKENCIIEEGYPRNDFLLTHTIKDIKKIKEVLNIDKNKKVILYAPTWRENQYEAGTGYTYNLGIDFNNLKNKLSDEYVVLFRAHYFIANSFNFDDYNGFVYDVSDYEDINDLYIISDLLITDYSSVFFDYANLKRPMIFYMYDFDEYKNQMRDFYYDLEILPGPIVKKEEDLIKEIKSSNFEKYKEKYSEFNKTFNYLDDGKASKRVIEKIFNCKLK